MKKLGFILAFSLLFLTTYAEVSSVTTQNEVVKLLGKTKNILENPNGVKYTFTLQMTKLFTLKGTMIQKEKKTKIVHTDGVIADNGTMAWAYDKGKNEVVILPSGANNKTPNSNFDILAPNAQYKVSQEGDVIKIKIKLKTGEIKNAEVTVKAGSGVPVEFKIKKGWFWMRMKFSNVSTGNFADSNFEYKATDYPGAKIEDRR